MGKGKLTTIRPEKKRAKKNTVSGVNFGALFQSPDPEVKRLFLTFGL